MASSTHTATKVKDFDFFINAPALAQHPTVKKSARPKSNRSYFENEALYLFHEEFKSLVLAVQEEARQSNKADDEGAYW